MHAITIAGALGSGKSSIAKALADQLNCRYYSTGHAQRDLADRLNLSTLELNRRAESDPTIDTQIDRIFAEQADSLDKTIVDSRMAWFFLKLSFDIYLDVDPTIAVDRVMADKRDVEKYSSKAQALSDLRSRKNSEIKRFYNTYGVNIIDLSNYDMVLDTSELSIDSACKLIHSAFRFSEIGYKAPHCWISPKRLIPTQSIRNLSTDTVARTEKLIRSKGFPIATSVQCCNLEDNYFIISGAENVLASIRSGINAIPIEIIEWDDVNKIKNYTLYDKIVDNVTKSQLYDWEAAGQFEYFTYPKII